MTLLLKKKKLTKVGNARYINIPKKYIDDGNIDPSSEYDISIEKSIQQ